MIRTIFIAASISLALSACGEEPVSQLHSSPLTDLPVIQADECPPGVFDVKSRDSHRTRNQFERLTLVGNISDKPEYHDCQRMINQDMSYGPRIALLARVKLDEVTFPRFDVPERAIPVAILYSWPEDTMVYSPLGLDSLYNCLYLWREPHRWAARVVNLRHDQKSCSRPVNPTGLQGQILDVSRPSLPGQADRFDIPPVVRWDWDSVHKTQYIGLRCDDRWCEVGPVGFTPSQAGTPASGNDIIQGLGPIVPQELLRVEKIKGWYDQQFLAQVSSAGRKPTATIATVWPHSQLDRSREPGSSLFDQGRFQPVAYVQVDAPYTKGLTVLYARGRNTVRLCRDIAGKPCPIKPKDKPECSNDTQDPDDRWWAEIVWADGTVYYRCVLRHSHADKEDLAIPGGTARWYWREDDEQLWVRCQAGCCLVN